MRTPRKILSVTSAFLVLAAVSVSAQQASVAQGDVKSLAGKWVGWGTPTSGSNIPIEVDIQPDGSYTSRMGATIGRGSIKAEAGHLVAEGHLSGSGSAARGVGKSQLTVATRDGKQILTGSGRDNEGPYDFQLTKQ